MNVITDHAPAQYEWLLNNCLYVIHKGTFIPGVICRILFPCQMFFFAPSLAVVSLSRKITEGNWKCIYLLFIPCWQVFLDRNFFMWSCNLVWNLDHTNNAIHIKFFYCPYIFQTHICIRFNGTDLSCLLLVPFISHTVSLFLPWANGWNLTVDDDLNCCLLVMQ